MKISVIVPIYNVDKYLDKCLDSLKRQTYHDFEVILVNDGSTDNSQSIIDKYTKTDQRFKGYIKENGGLADARNYGIDKALNDYLVFIDSDDYVQLNLIETIINNMLDSDILIFEYNQINIINNTVETINNKFNEDTIYNVDNNPNLITDIDNCAWNKCYKKSLFSTYRYPKGYLYEDLGTTYKLILDSKIVRFVNKPLVNYLVNRDGNITSTINDRIYHIFDMCKENIDYYKSKGVFDKYKDELKLLCWKNINETLKKLPKNTTIDFADKFIDSAFDFYLFYFGKKDVKINVRLIDNVYEYRTLNKLYNRWKRR